MSDNTEYKVQKLKIKNFKNIENLEMDLQGKSVFLIGDNALSKTSIIQAVWLALSNVGKPKKPIKDGADKAEILVVIGKDGKEYTIEKTFTDKSEKLEITSPEGFKTSKLENLYSLAGDINFDIMEFVQLASTVPGRREQVKMVRDFLGDDVNAKIDAINENIKNIEANRTELNVNIKRLKTTVGASTITDSLRESHKTSIDVGELMAKQTQAIEINSRIEQREREVKYQQTEIDNLKKREDEMQKAWEAIAAQRLEKEEKLKDIEKELHNSVKQDLEPIKAQIMECGTHNEIVEKIKAYDKEVVILEAAEKQYKDLGLERDFKNATKLELISKSKLPVEGLTIDEDMLYLNGIPLDETQQSTSELMEVGFKLAIAKNPNVRIVKVPRAESLGQKRLEAMMAFAKKNNFQVFYEEVQRGQEALKIQYVEDIV